MSDDERAERSGEAAAARCIEGPKEPPTQRADGSERPPEGGERAGLGARCTARSLPGGGFPAWSGPVRLCRALGVPVGLKGAGMVREESSPRSVCWRRGAAIAVAPTAGASTQGRAGGATPTASVPCPPAPPGFATCLARVVFMGSGPGTGSSGSGEFSGRGGAGGARPRAVRALAGCPRNRLRLLGHERGRGRDHRHRRRLRRPDNRRQPLLVLEPVRPARLHHDKRLLHQGQPDGRDDLSRGHIGVGARDQPRRRVGPRPGPRRPTSCWSRPTRRVRPTFSRP